MFSTYWIKLYHEILDDPKMGLLPDNVWRRVIELFLLAGKLDTGGRLPGTAELAWLLRHPQPQNLQSELDHLCRVGILTRLPDGWLVTHFAQRQAPIPPADRMRQYRDRQRQRAASGSSSHPPVQSSEFRVPSSIPSPEVSPEVYPEAPPEFVEEPCPEWYPEPAEGLVERHNEALSSSPTPAETQECGAGGNFATPEAPPEVSPELVEGHDIEYVEALPSSHNSPSSLSSPGSSCPPAPQPPRSPAPPPPCPPAPPTDHVPRTTPPQAPIITLAPDTPESRLLFAKINHNRRLRNRSPAKSFQSLEQKQKCLAAATRLGYSRFQVAVTAGLEKGLTDLASLINWIAKWEIFGGHNDRHQNYRPQNYGRRQPYRPVTPAPVRLTIEDWTDEEKREMGFT